MHHIRPRSLAASVAAALRARTRGRAGRPGRLRELAFVPRRRRPARGRRRSAAAAHLEHDGERRLEDADRRARLVVAGRLERPDLPDHRRQRRGGRGTPHGALLPLRLARDIRRRPVPRPRAGRLARALHQPAPLGGRGHRLRERRRPLDDRGAHGGARLRPAPQEHLRVVDAGDRRRAGLRLLRERRGLCAGPRRAAPVAEALRPGGDSPRLGARRLAGAARGHALHRQRQRRLLVPGGPRHGDRRRALARRPRRGHQLGHPLRLAERRAHGAHHRRQQPGAAPTASTARSSGASAG